jgi:hypothetical protein
MEFEMKNVVTFVDSLPSNIRTSVLYSVVGSLNASLVGSASAMVRQLEANGYDLKELSVADIETLFGGPETAANESALGTMRLLNDIVSSWRDDLQQLVGEQRATRTSLRVVPQLGLQVTSWAPST